MCARPPITICLLTYGDYFHLAQRALASIREHTPRALYRLVVGANMPSQATLALLERARRAGEIDHLIVSPINLSKCPMMRQMFAQVETDYLWWFDDDSYITQRGALSHWLNAAQAAPQTTAVWGLLGRCDHRLAFTDADPAAFVRSAPWYRGLPPPSWRPGGKGEFNFQGQGRGDGRWFFIFGGCWLARTSAIRALDWPDPRLRRDGDDVFLGEAVRQFGWDLGRIQDPGVAIDTEPRRGPRAQLTPASCHELQILCG